MGYTVKQVAEISGVSVRTLHFYDETGLLKPARQRANGYRFYEEPQFLTLQQILFYREPGFERSKSKESWAGPISKKSLPCNRTERFCKRTSLGCAWIETIDKTIEHLKGTKKMKSEEMFLGFSVDAGKDRFGGHIRLGRESNDCKVSA